MPRFAPPTCHISRGIIPVMPRWFSNEMLFALRARRESHRIASDIANPKLKIPPPTAPKAVKDRQHLLTLRNDSTQQNDDEHVPLLVRVVEMVILYLLMILVLWVVSNPRW